MDAIHASCASSSNVSRPGSCPICANISLPFLPHPGPYGAGPPRRAHHAPRPHPARPRRFRRAGRQPAVADPRSGRRRGFRAHGGPRSARHAPRHQGQFNSRRSPMPTLLIKIRPAIWANLRTLLVVDGAVRALSSSIEAPADAHIVDAAGNILFPSFIDVHTHLREPGQRMEGNRSHRPCRRRARRFRGHSLHWRNTDPGQRRCRRDGTDSGSRPPLVAARSPCPSHRRGHGRAQGRGAGAHGRAQGRGLRRHLQRRQARREYGTLPPGDGIRRRFLGLIVIDHCEDPYLAAKSAHERRRHQRRARHQGAAGRGGDHTGRAQHPPCRLSRRARAHRPRVRRSVPWTSSRGASLRGVKGDGGNHPPDDPTLDDTAVNNHNTLAKAEPAPAHARRCRGPARSGQVRRD